MDSRIRVTIVLYPNYKRRTCVYKSQPSVYATLDFFNVFLLFSGKQRPFARENSFSPQPSIITDS